MLSTTNPGMIDIQSNGINIQPSNAKHGKKVDIVNVQNLTDPGIARHIQS